MRMIFIFGALSQVLFCFFGWIFQKESKQMSEAYALLV